MDLDGVHGAYFAVWAPNAKLVSVTGNFNNWQAEAHQLLPRWDKSGIWEGFIPGVVKGDTYKYHIHTATGIELDKGDPYALRWETPPRTGSMVWSFDHQWDDAAWMEHRQTVAKEPKPWSVYEVHIGSWKKLVEDGNRSLNYKELATELVQYVKEMGFTHVEIMPLMEHPYFPSWGYQVTGYFAPTSRFGNPDDLKELVDAFHKAEIGVILDWVPSHFPSDIHGLYLFDGSHLYEYADMRKGYHPDWNSYIFNYKRGEVKSFLISSARFWCDRFHADGIRVDAVSSMLRLDYSRSKHQWEPNEYGGNGHLEAIAFITDLNETLYRDFPDIQTIAEEATDWPKISKPTTEGGLGFGMKWMMGWMHDTLDYFKMDALFRQFHQNKFSFSMMYFYDENFMLPLSHDEVVHGKSPMIYKMPGDEWQKFANLRVLYAYMFTHPGAKLLFMGNEFGSTQEWNYKTELPWHLLQFAPHAGLQQCVKKLNALYRSEPALFEKQFEPGGFEWIDLNHRSECVLVYSRKGKKDKDQLIVLLNVTPVVRNNWEVYVYGKSKWKEIFNSDQIDFWGTGDVGNPSIEATLVDKATKCYRVTINLPALSAIVLK